jgi:hypothetical protein
MKRSVAEVAKELGRRWRGLTQEQQAHYKMEAQKQKQAAQEQQQGNAGAEVHVQPLLAYHSQARCPSVHFQHILLNGTAHQYLHNIGGHVSKYFCVDELHGQPANSLACNQRNLIGRCPLKDHQ